jgi:hypothetical protein
MMSACGAARQPRYVEHVPTPPPRYELKGYSLVPSRDPGWIVAERNSEQIHFARRGANVDESYTIHAALTDLPTPLTAEELVRLMKARERNDIEADRFRLVTHEVVAQTHVGATCAKSYFLTQDLKPVRQSSRSDPMELEGSVLTCRHPGDPKIGVMIWYTQRRYLEDRDATFRTKAEVVLLSLEFTDPSRVPRVGF